MRYTRETPKKRPPNERVKDYKEAYLPFEEEKIKQQANRCMDCGIPFCHNGCPLGNVIPEFNDAVYREDWEEAYYILSDTNNFPEFTGRICPAPCEAACVLGINEPPVTIELIEKTIIERAYEKGYVKPSLPAARSGKSVAIIGSGPAGLAAAAQLSKAGHEVCVYERDDRIGGLLRYGIPDFKLEKWVIDRRLEVMKAEGIAFKTNAHIGKNIDANELLEQYDALVLCGGSDAPRDLPVEGRDASGIYFAMDFLKRNNKAVAGDKVKLISAKNKHVVVIGGGDTGADCVGTSNRHGAKSVTQLELLAKPPNKRTADNPWPLWPMILRTSDAHEEGCERTWSVLTKAFVKGESGKLTAIRLVDIEWQAAGGSQAARFVEKPETLREIPCNLALLAIGYLHPKPEGLLRQLGIALDERGNVHCEKPYQTSVEKVFAAGDMHRGQSLVVHALAEGREAAKVADAFLCNGKSNLEGRDDSMLAV